MFMNMNIILFYNMWLLLRTGYLTYTRKREVTFFFFVGVDCPKMVGAECVGGESIEAPRDQHKPRTLVSIMNVIYQRL